MKHPVAPHTNTCPIFQKLNPKDQQEILVLDAPASFQPEPMTLGGVPVIRGSKKLEASGETRSS